MHQVTVASQSQSRHQHAAFRRTIDAGEFLLQLFEVPQARVLHSLVRVAGGGISSKQSFHMLWDVVEDVRAERDSVRHRQLSAWL